MAGVGGIPVLGLARGAAQDAVAYAVVASLLVAVGAGVLMASRSHEYLEPAAQERSGARDLRDGSLSRYLSPSALVVVCVSAVQTWFTWGRSLAGGDIAPPEGTAWIWRIFEPWTWQGSDLGGPNASATQLPWAAFLEAAHVMGLPAWLAQRLWISLLFASAAIAAYFLFRVLNVGPIGAAVGALAYVFNPYVLSNVGFNDVYLAAMVLLAAYPALVLYAASWRLSKRAALVLLGAGAPLLGFAFSNPPLALMVASATGASVVVAWWIWGRQSAKRAAVVAGVGGIVVGLLSAYWFVPSLLQVSVDATGRLGTTSSWAWTEGRANLSNGLWLNTAWGWKFPIYYPYEAVYSALPLRFFRYLPAALAFGALPLALLNSPMEKERTRLALAAAGGVLFLVVLGTGTNAPGAAVFDPLYMLPYGWLLREPGRFLMAAGLGYGILTALTVELASPALRPAGKLPERRSGRMAKALASIDLHRLANALLVVAVVLVPVYPLVLGQVAPNGPRGVYPPVRVKFPAYWKDMASFLNRDRTPGSLLVLPQDDFYQMPYRWGYYGTDGFITNLVSRHVVDPTLQGYQQVQAELPNAVSAYVTAMEGGRWSLASKLLAGIGTPYVLVRGDVVSSFPGRQIVSPVLLARLLRSDPDMRLVHRSGPLLLFRAPAASASQATVTKQVATVDTTVPDLRVLGDLRGGTALVSTGMRPGIPAVLQLPPVAQWALSGQELRTRVATPAGWNYRLVSLRSAGGTAPRSAGVGGVVTGVGYSTRSSRMTVVAKLGQEMIANGSFRGGPRQMDVQSCGTVSGRATGSTLGATILGGAAPEHANALRFTAAAGTVCESAPLRWHGGAVLLSFLVRTVAGASPRICVWETATKACSPGVPAITASGSWSRVQTILHPDRRSGALKLYLYADALGPGHPTVIDYADVKAFAAPDVGQLAVLGTPARPGGSYFLTTANSSFSKSWSDRYGEHVVVDGLRNGWLSTSNPAGTGPRYPPASLFRLGDIVSICVAIAMGALAVSLPMRGRMRPRAKSETGRGIVVSSATPSEPKAPTGRRTA